MRILAVLAILFFAVASAFAPSSRQLRTVSSRHTVQFGRKGLAASLRMINDPHGGKLVNTMVKGCDAKNELIRSCNFEVELDERQLCDVELLMQGGFSPLDGFMGEADYKSVRDEMKLSSGLIFGLPVVFDTDDERMKPGARVLLKY